MRTPSCRDRGFSFIELLAYMAIAALLILAAVPQFNQYRAKAVVSNMRDTAHNAALAAEAANINSVSQRSGTGSIVLASARVTLAAAAASSNFPAIESAVAAVKVNGGENVKVSDEGAGDYVITVTSSKAPATTKVLYASKYTTADGVAVAPGTSTIVDSQVVGQQPTAGGSQADPSNDDANPQPADGYVFANAYSMTENGGKWTSEFTAGTANEGELAWTTTKTFTPDNVRIYLSQDDFLSNKPVAGAAKGSWTLNVNKTEWGNYSIWGSGDVTGLTADQRDSFSGDAIITFVDGKKTVSVRAQVW